MQKGKLDGEIDMLIFYGDSVPRCDRALVMNTLCSTRQYTDLSTGLPRFDPSLIDELEARGYDLDTLKFSITKKQETPTDSDVTVSESFQECKNLVLNI